VTNEFGVNFGVFENKLGFSMFVARSLVTAAIIISTCTTPALASDPTTSSFVSVSSVQPIYAKDGSTLNRVTYAYAFPGNAFILISDLGRVPAVGYYSYLTRSRRIDFRDVHTGQILRTLDLAQLQKENIVAFRSSQNTPHDFLELGRAQLSSGSEQAAISSFNTAYSHSNSKTQRARAAISLATAYSEAGNTPLAILKLGLAARNEPVLFSILANQRESGNAPKWREKCANDAKIPTEYTEELELPNDSEFLPPAKATGWEDSVSFPQFVVSLFNQCFYSVASSPPKWGLSTLTSTYNKLSGMPAGITAEVAIQATGVYRDTNSSVVKLELAVRETRSGALLKKPDQDVLAAAIHFFNGILDNFKNVTP